MFEVYNDRGYGLAENYMRIARQPVGCLVNFGHKGTLEWKRFILRPEKLLAGNIQKWARLVSNQSLRK